MNYRGFSIEIKRIGDGFSSSFKSHNYTWQSRILPSEDLSFTAAKEEIDTLIERWN
jgi:hypothetical protein